jgi:hypothetical protein
MLAHRQYIGRYKPYKVSGKMSHVGLVLKVRSGGMYETLEVTQSQFNAGSSIDYLENNCRRTDI